MVAGMPVVALPCPRATGIMVIVALTMTATRTEAKSETEAQPEAACQWLLLRLPFVCR